jgi:hypothetical protein
VYVKDPAGDHIHNLAYNDNHRLEQTTDFPWDEVDRSLAGEEPEESTVKFSDMTSAFSMVIDWCTQTKDIKIVAGRVYSLALLLWPESSKFASLADIADACDCSRAALSSALLHFKDQLGLALSVGKGHFTRGINRAAQNAAVARGTHSANTRIDRKDIKW